MVDLLSDGGDDLISRLLIDLTALNQLVDNFFTLLVLEIVKADICLESLACPGDESIAIESPAG